MRPHLVHWLDSLLPGSVASALAPTWFTCVGIAGVVTLFVMLAIARRHRIEPGLAASIVLWCYVAAVTAGIAVPMALDAAEQLWTTGRIHLRWAGMTSFWGYLAGAAAVVATCRRHDLALARFADLTVAPLGLALVLARLGCFLAGCDFGKVTSVPWAMRFPAGSPAWHDHVATGLIAAERAESLPVHPTQLYEAALGVAIAIVAIAASRWRAVRRGDGNVFLLGAAVYAVGRIVIEGLRGDAGRGIYLGLSSGQLFSIAVLGAIGGGLALRRPRRTHRPPQIAAIAALVLALGGFDRPAAHAEPGAPQRQPAASTRTAASTPAAASMRTASSTPAAASTPAAPASNAPAPTTAPAPTAAAAPTTGPAPQPAYGPGARPASAATAYNGAEASDRTRVHVGALFGLATPFNRRSDQVATLGGASLSVGLVMRRFGIWVDLDSLGNRDASHGTVLLSGSMLAPVASNLWIGGRIGFGATLVNFDDPAFRDVAGTAVRFEALVEYGLGESWAVWLRPLSFDILTAADLGGPIATWQTRIGLGYRFAVGRREAPASPRSR